MHLILTVVLALLLSTIGVIHLVRPSLVQRLVPEWWPCPRATVYLSGIAEILLGVGLVLGPTHQLATLLAGILLLSYAGVHLDDLRHVRQATTFTDRVPGVLLRSAVNVLYAGLAFYLAATA